MKRIHWRTALARLKTLSYEDRLPRHALIQSFQADDPQHKTSTEWAVNSAIEYLKQQGRVKEISGRYESAEGDSYYGQVLVITCDDAIEQIEPSIEPMFGSRLPYPGKSNEETTTPQESSITSDLEARIQQLAASAPEEGSRTQAPVPGTETGPRPPAEAGKTSPGGIPDFDKF